MKKIIYGVMMSLAAAVPSWADVTLKTATRSGGMQGMGGFESSGERSIQGLKERSESTMKFTGAFMKHISGAEGKTSIDILRLDMGKRWKLNPGNKTYTESPITPMSMREDGSGESGPAHSEKKPKEEWRLKKTDFDVKETGSKKTINGFSTAEYVVTFLMEMENVETKETVAYNLKNDLWVTPWNGDLRKAMEEEKDFAKAYMAKLGMPTNADMQATGMGMLKAMTRASGPELEKGMGDLQKKLAKVQGYPIVTDAEWKISGAGQTHKSHKSKAAPSYSDDQDESINLSGGLSGAAGSLLGGLAKKKMRQKMKENAAAPSENGEDGMTFTVHHEVRSISLNSLSKKDFDIPEGYVKKGH